MKRRRFLQTAGFSLTLPALESLGGEKDLEDSRLAKRLFLMTDGIGFHTPFFYPQRTGKYYPINEVLKPLEPLRNKSRSLVACGT